MTVVKALVADDEFFSGDVAWNVYSNAAGQYNPWYDGYYSLGTRNHCAAYPITSYMNLTNDPRLGYAFNKSAKNSSFDGQIPGSKTLTGDWMGISSSYGNDYVSLANYATATAMPIYLFTQSELQFLIAEVELRFNNNDGAAKEAYEKGEGDLMFLNFMPRAFDEGAPYYIPPLGPIPVGPTRWWPGAGWSW